jgi:hypothetical protein
MTGNHLSNGELGLCNSLFDIGYVYGKVSGTGDDNFQLTFLMLSPPVELKASNTGHTKGEDITTTPGISFVDFVASLSWE